MAANLSRFSIEVRLCGGVGLMLVQVVGLVAFGAQRLLRMGANVQALSVDVNHLDRGHAVTDPLHSIGRAALRYFADKDPGALEGRFDSLTETTLTRGLGGWFTAQVTPPARIGP